ncbi:NAD-dependent epimerase/dehydratase family protein [Aldersonia sp. NBC_00410]|uniref:NAD-dependent epimerase/dehydratase family protein n=1 Tax=Aldersonia sp. NBC_00410 TaxID=2975954 RepID=UPI00225121A2|nr:NAD-dependent epimerase/dehydratase family protein [Aldersonia sp. NBC_00410]MCX5043951.1 NAD-dependent epimerase/dehydratase family protein [Aldersonia sp. NBC_00410]
MRVLVTGAAGFIGSHICTALVEAGHEVVGTDAMLDSAHGPVDPPADVGRLDVRDAAGLDQALNGIDVVCHQAAIVGAGVSQQDAPAYASHNDLGTATLLAAMARKGCARLVLASSMVVYGDGRYRSDVLGEVVAPARRTADLDRGEFDPRCPASGTALRWLLVDEDAPLRPRSTYAASKVAQEHYALAWAAATGGSVMALRYHNVYGDRMPRDTPYSGVAAIFRSALEAGEPPQVFEDGRQTRDFVHVHDVARANVAAVERVLPGFVALNVCSGRPITVGEVAATLAEARGGPAPVVTGRYRAGDVRHIVANPRRATELLGFTAAIAPAEGLRQFAFAPLRAHAGGDPPRV